MAEVANRRCQMVRALLGIGRPKATRSSRRPAWSSGLLKTFRRGEVGISGAEIDQMSVIVDEDAAVTVLPRSTNVRSKELSSTPFQVTPEVRSIEGATMEALLT